MEKQIIITQNHVINSYYMDPHNCPLMKAIKEQAPELGIISCAGSGILKTAEGYTHKYSPTHVNHEPYPPLSVWCSSTADAIKKGEIESFTVTITEK